MRLVVLESPYAGNMLLNTFYARRCVKDSLMRGEAPFASHLLYTQIGILDDDIDHERARGIAAGHAWMKAADAVVIYQDRGISLGMQMAIDKAEREGRTIEYREIGDA